MFFHTLPSSTNGSKSDYYTQTMRNGGYSAGDMASYGCYYSFNTASAGTAPSSVSSGILTYNICPKNWTLPTNVQAVAAINLDTWNIVFSGVVYPTPRNLEGAGTGSYNWTRTVVNSQSSKAVYITSSGKQTYDELRYYGDPLKCIAQ